ncbi:MAG: FtsK/SpoIIIE domain-containing protein [Actinomycetota bacterium]
MSPLLLKLSSEPRLIWDLLGLPALWAWIDRRHGSLLVAAGVPTLGLLALLVWPRGRRWLVAVVRHVVIRRRFARAARHAGVVGAEDALPRVRRIVDVPAGERMQVRVPHGVDAGALESASEAIAASMRVREVRVVRDPANAAHAWVTVVRRDPLAVIDPLPCPFLDATAMTLTDPVPVGIDEEGEEVSVSLLWHNMLLGGETGSGKSGGLNMLVAASALDPSVRLTLLDGKLVELAVWRRCAEASVGVSVGDGIDVLRARQAEMEDRYRFLLEAGKRKVEPGDGLALHVVVVDELAHYLTAGDRKETAEFANLLRDLVSRGRAAGIIVLAATQKPSHDVIPTSLRDLFGFRWAFRCATPQASDTILGSGWASAGYSATSIDASTRGVGLLLHEGGTPTRMRAVWLGDEDLVRLATRAEGLRTAGSKQAAVSLELPPLVPSKSTENHS